ncbi:branched-chain amino acid transport system /permease component [bacterium BMS3Abin02]|nr:branched-chain amino acid transport system /permease component [bacterium BMS3Abin02]GBE21243.1 branched-chain amino acid transport system /permease component [bacterium BMS3Bbin01]HDH25851.1 ABC transporter permease [Actinomycetota bacterium]HDL48557.1 ABC transporter permease [Actinomycetota bacterium]
MEAVLASIVAASAPLVFAVVGETITEKAGVVNLSLDGSIMLSAMAGFAVAFTTGSTTLGFAAAAIVGILVALVIAYASITLTLNQVAVGFVMFALTRDLSTFLGNPYVHQPLAGVPHLPIPGLASIPFIGPVLFQQDLMVYSSIVLIFVTYWFIFRTRPGLKLQAVGERPEGAHSRGIPVNRLRYLYTAVGGAFVGIAGAAFSLDVKLGWSFQHTLNFGWIALAIVIFGGWHPYRAALGAYLFGALQIVAIQLQPVFPTVSQILPSLPFPIMILTLLIVYTDWLKELANRFPALREFLASEPPSAGGTRFEPE